MGISESYTDEYDYLTQILNRRSGDIVLLSSFPRERARCL